MPKAVRPFRVLCIDGGGIRGIIPAVWLAKVEERLKELAKRQRTQSLAESFDLICGTSTGAILAAAVAHGISMDQVLDLYTERGAQIFPRRGPQHLVSRMLGVTGLLGARYNHRPLQAVLEEVLGNARLSDAKVPLCIPSYDIANRRTFYFRSYDPDTRNNETWKACLASASAPTYFPVYRCKLNSNDGVRYLVDGGVSANNPSGVGLAEAIALQKTDSLIKAQEKRRIQLVSLGTGGSTRNLTRRLKGNKGVAAWAPAILDVMFDGSSDVSAYIAEQILDADDYIRLQFNLNFGLGNDDMDNASTDNLEELVMGASNHITKAGKRSFDALMRMIAPPPPPPARPRVAAEAAPAAS